MSKGIKKKLKRKVGELVFNEKHSFFHGYVHGQKVTMNEVTLKDGSVKWLLSEDFEVYETEVDQAPGFFGQ